MVNKKACVFFMGFFLLQGGYTVIHLEEAQAQQVVPFSQREQGQEPQRQQGELEKQLNEIADNVKLGSEDLDKASSTMKPLTRVFNKSLAYATMFLIAWTVIQSLLDIIYIQTKPIRPLFEKYSIPTKGAKIMITPSGNGQQSTPNGVQSEPSTTAQGANQQNNVNEKMSTSKAMLKYMQIRAKELVIMAIVIGVLLGTMLIGKVSSLLALI